MITLQDIEKKLGFNPKYPPVIKREPDVVDDTTPSIWAPLEPEELIFVMENCMGVSKEDIDKLREYKNG